MCICVAFLLAYTVVLLYDIFSFRIRFIGISNYRDMIELLVNTLLVNRDVEAHFFPFCCRSEKMYWMCLTTFRNIKTSFRNWGVKLDDSKKKSKVKQFLEVLVLVSKKLSCKKCENKWLPISKNKWTSGIFTFFINHATSSENFISAFEY